MEFKQLEMLVALAEERSVRQAADRVFRTQQAVSMAMAKLEQEVGATLFDRRDRFRLTPPGEILYDYARRLLQLRENAETALARPCEGLRHHAGLGSRETHESFPFSPRRAGRRGARVLTGRSKKGGGIGHDPT